MCKSGKGPSAKAGKGLDSDTGGLEDGDSLRRTGCINTSDHSKVKDEHQQETYRSELEGAL
jgi:hypothetical protein